MGMLGVVLLLPQRRTVRLMGEMRLALRMVDPHSDIRVPSLMSRCRGYRRHIGHILGRMMAILVVRLTVGSCSGGSCQCLAAKS